MDVSDPPEIEYGDCIHMMIQPGHGVGVHKHVGVTEVAVLLRGRLRTHLPDCELTAQPGDVLIYPGQLAHEPRSMGPGPAEWISMWWSGGLELGRIRGPEVRSDLEGRIVQQLGWLVDLGPAENEADRGMASSLAYTIVYELGRLAEAGGDDLAGRVRRYLRQHLAEPLTLEHLAEQMGLSKYHFIRKFKQSTGQTPMRLLNEMRVDAAKALLTQTELSLEEIARHVGLADASHLSHTFRRVADCTPGSLRR